jgi:gliding motility-associated-like protein
LLIILSGFNIKPNICSDKIFLLVNYRMRVKIIAILLSVLFAGTQLRAQQACTVLGQNPSTAFPVCGTDTFSQSIVPYCGGVAVPGPCTRDGVTDTNPFWYKFTCFSSGTLGFVITPSDLNDDYDWQLFDVTGHNPGDVYNDISLFVACNWSGNSGITGASSAGNSLQNCAGYTYPTFSSRPTLIQGHNYLLLISHFTVFTPSQNGYKLSFGGGTASITDPKLPDLQSAKSSCDGAVITLKLNKKMKCATLAANGSDFTISPAMATVTGAAGIGCNLGFDMDSVTLILSNPLPVGNYTLTIKNGTDGNTLLDNCDRNIPVGNNLPFAILPLQPTPMDSLTTVSCAPGELQLVFKKNIRCNSIAADGSDFIVTGPGPVTVSSASGSCNNGLSPVIIVKLASPVVNGGVYQIQLQRGTDGNTIIDECGQETAAGATLPFITKDTVSAAFSYQVFLGCKGDTIDFTHDGRNGVNQWLWRFDLAGASAQQNPVFVFNTFGQKQVLLAVSNGFCSDTVTQTISLNNELKAAFETSDLLCPEDAATFKNNSTGDIINYNWDFGDGSTSILQTPVPKNYPKTGIEKIYPVQLVVKNNAGCFDTATATIKVLKTCYIAVPNAFTPNGDGFNDYLYPLNAYKAGNLEFNVYNRFGQLVFHTTDWTRKWDGKINGNLQSTGTYVWTLRYTNLDTGKKVFLKGTSILIR